MTKVMFRVECNRGSKYFTNAREAFAYFHKKVGKGFRTEIFIRITVIDRKLFKVTDELLDHS